MNSIQLPEDYQPFRELVICSNNFINGKVPLRIRGQIPFLVGKGEKPVLWITGPVGIGQNDWRKLVEKDQILDSRVKRVIDDNNRTIMFLLDYTIMIQVEKISEDKAVIQRINFRPLGLDISGDQNGLLIGKMPIVNNSFENITTMINIG